MNGTNVGKHVACPVSNGRQVVKLRLIQYLEGWKYTGVVVEELERSIQSAGPFYSIGTSITYRHASTRQLVGHIENPQVRSLWRQAQAINMLLVPRRYLSEHKLGWNAWVIPMKVVPNPFSYIYSVFPYFECKVVFSSAPPDSTVARGKTTILSWRQLKTME